MRFAIPVREWRSCQSHVVSRGCAGGLLFAAVVADTDADALVSFSSRILNHAGRTDDSWVRET
jgi:hypothetical protein